MKDDAIWANVLVQYKPDPKGPSRDQEIALLKQLGFSNEKGDLPRPGTSERASFTTTERRP